MNRFAFVSCHPAPYRDAFIARCVDAFGDQMDVYSQYPCDKGHKFADSAKEAPRYKANVLNKDNYSSVHMLLLVLRLIFYGRYSIVIWPGFMDWYIVFVMWISAILGKPYGFSADTIEQRSISPLKRAVKKFIIKRASLILVPGSKGRDFFISTYGCSESKIVIGCYSLDGAEIEKKVLAYRSEFRRKRRDIDCTRFLMVANMIPTRHYPITCDGFLQFCRGKNNVKFVIVGSGVDSEKVKKLAAENPTLEVHESCSFETVLKLYAEADIYVHGGKEPASTALVIGAISHLPIVSSKAVGCSADVLRDGINGCDVGDYLSSMHWKMAFERIYQLKSEWRKFGEESRRLSRHLDVDVVVSDFVCKMKQDFHL